MHVLYGTPLGAHCAPVVLQVQCFQAWQVCDCRRQLHQCVAAEVQLLQVRKRRHDSWVQRRDLVAGELEHGELGQRGGDAGQAAQLVVFQTKHAQPLELRQLLWQARQIVAAVVGAAVGAGTRQRCGCSMAAQRTLHAALCESTACANCGCFEPRANVAVQ